MKQVIINGEICYSKGNAAKAAGCTTKAFEQYYQNGRLDILWKGTKKYFKAKQIVELHRELHSR